MNLQQQNHTIHGMHPEDYRTAKLVMLLSKLAMALPLGIVASIIFLV